MSNVFDLNVVAISHYISRSGTLYLHSLLDNHPEIITIPGTIDIVEILKSKNCNAEKYLNIFIKNNPKFFDTSSFNFTDKNNSSLWILGDDKKQKIVTDKIKFKNYFLEILRNKKGNPRNAIIALYLAYAQTHNKLIDKVKIILMHPHEKKTTLMFNEFFKDSLYLIPVRNPFRAYNSIIKKSRFVSEKRNVKYYPGGQLSESASDIKNFYKKKMKMNFFKIEDLAENIEPIMKNLASLLNISFNKSMLESTFGGLKYWSNSVEKQSNQFDTSRHKGEIELPKKDLIILNAINLELIEILNYKKINFTTLEKIFFPLIFFSPMRDEVKFIKEFKVNDIRLYLRFFMFFFPKRLNLLRLVLSNKYSRRYDYLKNNLI